jgi:hypothetical protein
MNERLQPLKDYVHRLRSVVEAERRGDFGTNYVLDGDSLVEIALAEEIHALIEKRRLRRSEA